MRVLTATTTTQGERPDDIAWTTEGELVSLPLLECSCPDCGCDRSFAGLDSHRATTTCVVTDAPLDGDGLHRAVARSLAATGWLVDVPAVDHEMVDDVVARILEVAGAFPPGTVLGRADGGVVVRRPAPVGAASGWGSRGERRGDAVAPGRGSLTSMDAATDGWTELPDEAMDGAPAVLAPSAAAWRSWLDAHAATAPAAWLVMARSRRGDGGGLVGYEDAVCQALCVGWIDSQVRPRDETTRYQRFSPRNPRSTWVRSNRDRVERLIVSGEMAPAGMALVEAAQASGSWDLLADVEDGIVPDDVRAALDAVPEAAEHFAGFPPSARLQILSWIVTAKKPETRAVRIATTVERAARGERAR